MKNLISGEFVRDIRKDLLLSRRELSKILKIHENTIYLWESGKFCPSFKYLREIKELCKKNNLKFENYLKQYSNTK